MSIPRTIASVLAFGLLATACGGDDGLSGADAELSAALAGAWEAEGEFEGYDDIPCLADGFISGVGGADAAAELGVTVENIADTSIERPRLNETQAVAAAGNMWACDGFQDEFIRQITGPIDDDAVNCLKDGLSEEPMTSLLASSFMGDAGAELEAEFENVFEEEFFTGVQNCNIEL